MTRALALLLLCAAPSLAAPPHDIKDGHDHPLITRFPGSALIAYKDSNYDELNLPRGPVRQKRYDALAVKGAVTRLLYWGPAGQGPKEVFLNYKNALQGAGFKILYEGRDAELGGSAFKNAAGTLQNFQCVYASRDTQYLLAQARRGARDVTVAVHTGECRKDAPGASITIVESREARSGQVQVDAKAMWQALEQSGSVSLYGIYFDFDSAVVKPESEPALKEIAALLAAHPALKLAVVGHTDASGKVDYNVDLSERRARAVAKALAEKHAVDPSRLIARGVGPFAPKASNRAEDTRAQNRRVELVELP